LQKSATYEQHGAGPRFPWVALTHFLSIRTPFNGHRAHLGKPRTCRLAGRDVSAPLKRGPDLCCPGQAGHGHPHDDQP
jgi:hypothetical protein